VQKTADLVDKIKQLGFIYATRSGMTIAVSDIKVPEIKQQIIQDTTSEVEKAERQYRRGLITEEEQYNRIVELWTRATDDLTQAVKAQLDPLEGLGAMAISGASGMLADDDAFLGGFWQQQFLNQWMSKIGGGTDQVQRNIVGENVLGLPSDGATFWVLDLRDPSCAAAVSRSIQGPSLAAPTREELALSTTRARIEGSGIGLLLTVGSLMAGAVGAAARRAAADAAPGRVLGRGPQGLRRGAQGSARADRAEALRRGDRPARRAVARAPARAAGAVPQVGRAVGGGQAR
jgi:hypothetical protein